MSSRETFEGVELAHASTVIVLTVNNHPGVMSHICGLFSRRAYNLEGIVCLPESSGETSRIWLQVNERSKLDQVVKQLSKLPDIHMVWLVSGNQFPDDSLLSMAMRVDCHTLEKKERGRGPSGEDPQPCR